MANLLKAMPSFEGVAVGAKATARLPVGLTYRQLFINHLRSGVAATEAQMKAEIEDIRLLIDGNVVIEASATELLDLYKYYGYTVQNGQIPLIFSRPWARTINGEDALAYGTKDVQTMSLEVNIASGATSPALALNAVQSAPTNLGQHVVIKRFSRSAAGAGVLEEANLPRGPYGLLAIHASSSALTDVQVLANERIVWEGDASLATQLDHLTGKVSQSGYFHINFANTDRVGDNLPLNLEDFRIKSTFSGPSTFKYILERIDSFVPGN